VTSLSDILAAGGGDNIRDLWDSTDAAGELGPLPIGEYVADIIGGELETSQTKKTPGFKMTFSVVEPDGFAGRRFWHDCWLTPRRCHKQNATSPKLAFNRSTNWNDHCRRGFGAR
jgi:hypothetical protein